MIYRLRVMAVPWGSWPLEKTRSCETTTKESTNTAQNRHILCRLVFVMKNKK